MIAPVDDCRCRQNCLGSPSQLGEARPSHRVMKRPPDSTPACRHATVMEHWQNAAENTRAGGTDNHGSFG